MKKLNLLFTLTIAIALTIVCSCSENDSWADNYVTNLAELDTNADGVVCAMRLDNGKSLTVANTVQLQRPDTTYRTVCVYTYQGNSATIASYAHTYSSLPITDTSGFVIKHHPCQLQSVWLSGDYLNARMLIQGKDQPHIIAFIDKGITVNPDQSHTLTIFLHHDQNNDPQAFTRTIYLSCPLRQYSTLLQHNRDTVTFTTGTSEFKLPY